MRRLFIHRHLEVYPPAYRPANLCVDVSTVPLDSGWDHQSVGHLPDQITITGKANPNIAYRVNDWLSVGAGFSFSVARLLFQSKINNNLTMLGRKPDGGLIAGIDVGGGESETVAYLCNSLQRWINSAQRANL